MGLPRSKTALALLLLLSVFAGCLHSFDGSDRNGTELGSHALTVEKEDVATTPTSIVDFAEMTSGQQETFRRALNGSYNTVRIPKEVSYEVWYDYEYVRYKNETYSVVVAVP